MPPGADSTLNQHQARYYQTYMAAQCPAHMLTTATNRITWRDSAGIVVAAYYRQGTRSFGPSVPILAQETLLVLTRALQNQHFQKAATRLTHEERQCLAGTTTDKVPEAIFRIGMDSMRKAIMQHAMLLDETPYTSAVALVQGLIQSGIFLSIGIDNYWELQASTAKRGMVDGHFETVGGRIRFSRETHETKRAMKRAKMREAREIMSRAVQVEDYSVEGAIQRYARELDQIAEQYARLPEAEYPYCLGMMPHAPTSTTAQPTRALDVIAPRFLEVFALLAATIRMQPVR